MLAEACRPIRGVRARPDGSDLECVGPLAVDDVAALPALTSLLDLVPAPAPVKMQVAGPVTLATALTSAGIDEAVARVMARDATRRSLAAMAMAASGRRAVVFLDEPALVRGPSPAALDDLAAAVAAARQHDFIVGVHVCGAGDIATAVAAGPDIIGITLPNADRSGDVLVEHLDRGGWIAWAVGAAPWNSLRSALAVSGEPSHVARRSLVTPECGLAGFDEKAAVGELNAVAALGNRLAALAVTPAQ